MPRQLRLVGRIGQLSQAERDRAAYCGGWRHPLYPSVMLIEGDETQAMRYGFRADGEFCGDTWSESVDAAKNATVEEFGDRTGEWMPVPESVSNAFAYARSMASQPPASEA